MTRCHVYDLVYELKPEPDLISLSSVSLLEDTKPKTHTDFGHTMKALRSLVSVLESNMT